MSTTGLNDFYLFCDSEHRELYSVLLSDWQEMGLVWHCEPKVLCLGVKSVLRGGMFICFTLHAGGAEPASIRMDLEHWRKYLGQEDVASVIGDIRRIQGLRCQQHGGVFLVDNPGHILAPIQKQLRDIIHRLGVSLANKMAP